jgi:phosphodiesterase/alkaline phosphatase D-like protein
VAAAAATVLIAPTAAPAQVVGFTSGVTAGEVTAHTAIVWGRTDKPSAVVAQVARDAQFKNLVRQRSLRSTRTDNNTVQTQFDGFAPNTRYHYRFCYPGRKKCSVAGKFKTAPRPGDSKTIRFAYSGDESAVPAPGETEPFWGFFEAFKTMAAENNDFNIDFGDTIYSDPEVPGAATASTVAQKWSYYRKKLALENMQQIRGSAALYNHWDDHEFINDFSIPEDGRPLYDRSVRAFRDYMPVTYSAKNGIYRTARWGKNLELFFLDQRSFRSAKASANHVCDNSGSPDLAPTAPQSTRNFFSALVPSLANPVSQACKNKINDPNRTYLGSHQLQRFISEVKRSTARWKVVMNELPIQQYYALPYDRWEGYAHERIRLLKALDNANVSRLVFLTTDVHAGLANVVRYRTLSGDVAPANAPATAPTDSPYQDFVIGPVGTTPFWQEIDEVTGTEGSGQLISNLFFKPAATGSSPGGGMGMACAQGGMNSYAEVTVTGSTFKIAYKDENGDTLVDSDGTTPCGPYVLTN